MRYLKSKNPKYTYGRLAKYCRIQKTYLSRVINHDADLSEDQLYLTSQYLQLNHEETEYLQLLHGYERTNLDGRRQQILKDIELIQSKKMKTESHLSRSEVVKPNLNIDLYYTEPWLQIIHMCLTIPKYSKQPLLLGPLLRLSETEIQGHIAALKSLKLVTESKGKVIPTKDDIHMPTEHPLYATYRTMTRLKSIEQMARLPIDKRYSFSVVFSSNPQTRAKIHQEFLQFLKKVKSLVESNKESHVYQLNFDLFDWT